MIIKRCQDLASSLSLWHLDAVLVMDEESLRFLSYNAICSGRLFVSSKEVVLFVSAMDYSIYSQLKNIQVIQVDSFASDSLFHKFFLNKEGSIGIDSSLTSYDLGKHLQYLIPQLYCVAHLFASLRIIKDEQEIEILKEAGALGTQGYWHILSRLAIGVSEKELVAALKVFWAQQGADGVAFAPIVAFGENTAYPHWHASDRRLQSGDLVLIDIGVSWQGYCSDMTRVILFKQNNDFWDSCYRLVKEAQAKGLECCQAGKTNRQVHAATKQVFIDKGQDQYFIHGTGHGVGMQVHEAPYISSQADEVILSQGMVITIEPGLYYPDKGGIRLEDSILFLKEGYCNLTNVDLPSSIPVI